MVMAALEQMERQEVVAVEAVVEVEESIIVTAGVEAAEAEVVEALVALVVRFIVSY